MPKSPQFHKRLKTMKVHDPRPDSSKRGYDRKWRKVRGQYLAMNPLCCECLEAGKTEPAFDVDHIKPLLMGGERLDFNNLQSLCRRCHNKKTHGGNNGN